MAKYVSCDCKCKFKSARCDSNQKWNNKTCQCEYKNCKKDYSWNPSPYHCENGKYLKSIVDDSVIACDEIIFVMDIATTNMANTIATNATSVVSINCHNKKVRFKVDCYILHTVILEIILLLIITIICYHYAKYRSKINNILLC